MLVHSRYGKFSMMVMEKQQLVLYGMEMIRKYLIELFELTVNDFLEWSWKRKADKLFRKRK